MSCSSNSSSSSSNNNNNNNSNNNDDDDNDIDIDNDDGIEWRNLRLLTISLLRRKRLQHMCSICKGEIVCRSRATLRVIITCSMQCGGYEGTAQLLNLTELKSHLLSLYLVG